MRNLAYGFLFVLAGCERVPEAAEPTQEAAQEETDIQPMDVVEMLKAGDFSVCSHPVIMDGLDTAGSGSIDEVREEADISEERYNALFRNNLEITGISVSGTRPELNEITCQAVTSSGVVFSFTLRPTTDENRYFMQYDETLRRIIVNKSMKRFLFLSFARANRARNESVVQNTEVISSGIPEDNSTTDLSDEDSDTDENYSYRD